jgi:hypothetical protein
MFLGGDLINIIEGCLDSTSELRRFHLLAKDSSFNVAYSRHQVFNSPLLSSRSRKYEVKR